MIDHMGFRVRDLAASRRFYAAAMAAIGLGVIDNTDTSFLLARSAGDPVPFLWIGTDRPSFWQAGQEASASPIHVAFVAPNRAAVDAFHRAALAAGGTDNGAPGVRGPSEMGYYAAYVLDPGGNNIEAAHRSAHEPRHGM